jgi:hypothetical protein
MLYVILISIKLWINEFKFIDFFLGTLRLNKKKNFFCAIKNFTFGKMGNCCSNSTDIRPVPGGPENGEIQQDNTALEKSALAIQT